MVFKINERIFILFITVTRTKNGISGMLLFSIIFYADYPFKLQAGAIRPVSVHWHTNIYGTAAFSHRRHVSVT